MILYGNIEKTSRKGPALSPAFIWSVNISEKAIIAFENIFQQFPSIFNKNFLPFFEINFFALEFKIANMEYETLNT